MKAVAVGAAVGVVAGPVLGSPLLVVMAPTVTLMAMVGYRQVVADRRARHQGDELVAQVDQIVQGLKGGQSLNQAIRAAFPELGAMIDQGSPLAVAVDQYRTGSLASSGSDGSRGPSDLPLVLGTVSVLLKRGGSALDSMERLSDALRSARQVELEVMSQASQATASSVALAGLPLLFGLGLAAFNRDMAQFYLFEVPGALCVWFAALASFAGWLWMNRLIASATRIR